MAAEDEDEDDVAAVSMLCNLIRIYQENDTLSRGIIPDLLSLAA